MLAWLVAYVIGRSTGWEAADRIGWAEHSHGSQSGCVSSPPRAKVWNDPNETDINTHHNQSIDRTLQAFVICN